MIVALKYFIIFEPSEAWQSQGEFADGLEAYFRSNGYTTEYVQTQDDKETVIYLQKAEEPTPLAPKVTTLKQEMAQQTAKRGFDGKFRRSDGR